MKYIILKHSDLKVAKQIFRVLRSAYQIEADLIGVTDFPPLMRAAEKIRDTQAIFYGCFQDGELIGVCEIEETQDGNPHIASLGVHPSMFRGGVGSGLVQYVLRDQKSNQITVNTAAKNIPAISLYEKLGFSICKRFETYDEVNLVTLMKNLE